MKKNLPLIALLLLVVTASSAPAAIQYEFRQTTSSDLDTIPSTDCAGRAIIDGDRSRIEFVTGNAYPPGTYLIATNGSRTMTIDKWTTNAFGDVGDTFLASGALHTGNPDLDDLMSAENTNIKGFPLKQIVNVTTINSHAAQNTNSQLHMNRMVTQTRELLVTSIQPKAAVGLATFSIPVTYHKAGPIHDDTQKAPVQVLSMEPAEK